jgi:hypothetical protein
MKLKLFSIVLIITLLSCSNQEQRSVAENHSEKLQLLEEENNYLKKVNEEKDSAINNFMGTINEISQNIDIIKQKENIISLSSLQENMDENMVEAISKDILFINDLMEQNRKTIENLNYQLNNSIIYSEELQTTIDNFLSIINNQEKQIKNLQDQLLSYHGEFEVLQSHIDSLKIVALSAQEELLMNQSELNTAYYITGYPGDLRDYNIIRNKGGIFGIGSVYILLEDFNKSMFDKIDITEVTKIPINCRKAELLSKHPSYSYKFDGPSNFTNNLVITRPKEFWSTSKYLVILKK